MNTESLAKQFDLANLPLQVVPDDPRLTTLTPDQIPVRQRLFYMDIVTRRKNRQNFRLFMDSHSNIEVLDAQPRIRHVLLHINRPLAAAHNGQCVLCGHDETQLFIANLKTASTIKDAFEALKPPIVLAAEQANLTIKRQGDWFFYPVPTPRVDPDLEDHFREEMIGGPQAAEFGARVGNPHVAEAQFVVYERFPSYVRNSPRKIVAVFVRGRIEHREHATLVLKGWHRAVQSGTNFGASQIPLFGVSSATIDPRVVSIGYFD
jgi:hypothetical protein